MSKPRVPPLTEKEHQAQVLKLAVLLGWDKYHTYDSRRSEPGFPDWIFVKGPWLLFVELKRDTGRLTRAQRRWLELLRGAGQVAMVWRPRDWPLIEKILKEGP